MPVSIQIVPDRFDQAQNGLSSGLGQRTGGTASPHVRRPTRGIVLKEDTFATIRVVAMSNNEPVHLVDAGSNRKVSEDNDFLEVNGRRMTDVYSNFLLQSVQEDRVEKQQIMETFGEPYIFLFGERARLMHFSGVLVNSFDFNWEAEWWDNYENYLRGTRCVENDARVYLAFDETLISGYILNTQSQKSAQERNFVQFTFSLFVTGYTNFSKIGSPDASQGESPFGLGYQDPEKLRPFRPTLLQPNEEIARAVLKDGRLDTNGISLAEGIISSSIREVDRAFSRAQAAVNRRIQNIGNALTGAGNVVRVPFGFAGAMAFEDDRISVQESIFLPGKPVVATYTVFSDNVDEYVGSSSHFGSSFTGPGVVFEDPASVSDRELVERAKDIWEANGFSVSSTDTSKLIAQARSGVTLGLQITNAVKSFSQADITNDDVAEGLTGGRAGGLPDIET